jgi:hypothetical protein
MRNLLPTAGRAGSKAVLPAVRQAALDSRYCGRRITCAPARPVRFFAAFLRPLFFLAAFFLPAFLFIAIECLQVFIPKIGEMDQRALSVRPRPFHYYTPTCR